jgi:hypothetical protein
MLSLARPALIVLAMLPLLASGIAGVAAAEPPAPLGTATDGSQAKNDRDARRNEARIDHLQHSYDHHTVECMHGQEDACGKARVEYGEMQDLRQLGPAQTR